MIRAILLDLDDTLLGNPTDSFTQNYLGLLGQFVQERLGIEHFAQPMLAGIRALIERQDPLRTNWDTFFEALEEALPLDRAAFDAAVAEFYRDVYPALREGTTLRPSARQLITRLLEHDYTVVVATNPFFPRVAVEQRLAWADCAVGEHRFALVTTLENMHFVKPQPAYFEEILARVGADAGEALMVGDDWERDIRPAQQAGLNTFWIAPPGQPAPAESELADGQGTLDDLLNRVRAEHWLATLAPRPLEPGQIAPRFAGNLAALAGIVQEAPPDVWSRSAEDAAWSPLEGLCALAAREREVHRPALACVAQEENPLLSPPDQLARPEPRDCPEDPWAAVEAFAAERQHTLDFLTGLDAAAWQRPARHTVFGPTTLLGTAARIAQFDRQHVTQLRQALAEWA